MDDPKGSPPYVVIAGYGLPGRTLVELLTRRRTDYLVIELNPQTCERAAAGGVHMIAGSAADPEVLHRAGVHRATLVALMVPSDQRRRSACCRPAACCPFTNQRRRGAQGALSWAVGGADRGAGAEAVRRGADQSIVAEQVIARELEAITSSWLPPQ